MKIKLFGYNIDINKIKKGIDYKLPSISIPQFKIIKKKIKQADEVELENKLKKQWE